MERIARIITTIWAISVIIATLWAAFAAVDSVRPLLRALEIHA